MKQSELNRRLARAIEAEDLQLSEQLITKGADINGTSRTVLGATLVFLTVHAACQNISPSNKRFAALLTDYLETPHPDFAAARARDLRILKLLFKLGADVNKPNQFGATPLSVAVRAQDLETVRLLLAHGADAKADVNSIFSSLAPKARKITLSYFRTVLHTAVENNDLAITQALLEAGADPNRGDEKGTTAFEMALKTANKEMIALLRKHGGIAPGE